MTDQNDTPPGDRPRESNKPLLLGAFLLMALAVGIAYQSLQALHAHAWVDLGLRMHRRLVPPFVGFVVALGTAAVGLYCAWGCVPQSRLENRKRSRM